MREGGVEEIPALKVVVTQPEFAAVVEKNKKTIFLRSDKNDQGLANRFKDEIDRGFVRRTPHLASLSAGEIAQYTNK